MSLLGRSVVLLALLAASFAVVTSLRSHQRRRGARAWLEAAERAILSLFGLLSVAMIILWVGLLDGRFRLRNVADYTSAALSWPFKITALWASQAGSLLLWAWLLAGFSALVVVINRHRNRELMPVVIAVLAGLAVFFTGLLSFVTSPFETLATVPRQGNGLTPALQNAYMAVHPPLLYLGYVSLAIPFAFAIAALVTGKLDSQWLVSVRRWTILSWLFLGAGIIVGGKWAYEALSFGGYWAWDPVENASFMPWLVATAFLHSVMVQERRGMLKVWNMALVTLSFSLALFGTFITRSGLLSSVHAFGAATVGPYFLALITIVLIGSAALIVSRLGQLRSDHSLESFVSREAIFLYNNLLLLGLAFTVFWGTIFPILSEVVRGERITVSAGFFNQIAMPIGLALLLLTGVGPLVAWRKASSAQLRRRFTTPLVAALVAAPLLVVTTDAWSSWPAGVAFTISAFVGACIAGEFWRGMKVRHALGGVSWAGALIQLIGGNRRRYGGYVVHVGVVVLIVGIAASRAFSSEGDFTLREGERGHVAGLSVRYEGAERSRASDRMSVSVTLGVFDGDGKRMATMTPRQNIFLPSRQPGNDVAISSGLRRDLWINLSGLKDGVATLVVFVNPLVSWIWLGGLITVVGALVAAWPAPRRVKQPSALPRGAQNALRT